MFDLMDLTACWPILSPRLLDVFRIIGHNAILFCTWSYPFFSILAHITGQSCLLIAVEVIRVINSGLSDTTRQMYRSVNVVTCPCFWYTTLTPFTLFHSKIILLGMCLCNNIPTGIDLSIAFCEITSLCSSFYTIAHFFLVYNITDKIVLLKRLAHRILSSFALSTSFIVAIAFHPDLILKKIFAYMFRHLFNIHHK